MTFLRYIVHLILLLFRRKKITLGVFLFVLFAGGVYISRDIITVYLTPEYVFDDSIKYCNSPHRVTGDENKLIKGYILRQIQVLIRHGDRAPINLKALPNTSPVYISCIFNKTKTEYRMELNRYREVIQRNVLKVSGSSHKRLLDERLYCKGGQLTPFGFLQHLYLGEHLRASYDEFLENVDIFNDVWIQATDVQRTIQSSAALISAIFYDQLKHASPNEHSLLINVFKDRLDESHFLLNHLMKDIDCHPFVEKLHEYHKNNIVSEFQKNLNLMSEKFAEVLSVDRSVVPPINRIADILYTKLCHGQGVPYGPHLQIPPHLVTQTFKNAHIYFTAKSSFAPELQMLALLSQIAQHWNQFKSVPENPSRRKFVLYSGHDSMITPFLVLLGINDNKWSPYASRIIFEFYEKQANKGEVATLKDQYFRVLYNGHVMRNLKICNPRSTDVADDDDGLCNIKDLYRYVSNNLFNEEQASESSNISILYERINKLCHAS